MLPARVLPSDHARVGFTMQRLLVALLFFFMISGPSVRAQDAKLAVKLGPNPAAWQVAPYQGKIDAVNIDGDGRPAAAIGSGGLVLTTTAPIARDTELLVRFRITLPKGQGSGLYVVAGQKKTGASA